jgi:ferredoxin
VAFVIAQPCIGHKDLGCTLVCPTDAIVGLPGDPQLYIDPDLCIHCGLCLSVCPVGAIFPEEDLPEAWVVYAERNRAYFRRLGS